jgi:hypothetical protein
METITVVATEEEYQLAKEHFGGKIIKTGVGGLNVIKALQSVPTTTKIINFGYVGSNNIPKGTIVTIGKSMMYHPNCEYEEPTFELKGKVKCYTSNDFVLQTDIQEPVVFDMELAYICALGYEVEAIKIVSDNLDYNEYEETINQ